MQKKIKILFLASDPRDVGYRPTLDEEFRQIRKSLLASKLRDSFELACELAVQPADLREALARHEPEIIHYSGHANSKGLVLQNSVGRRTLVSRSMLRELLRTARGVRIVLLNACYSEAQLDTIAETVDFTIGTRGEVWDKNAVVFAASFYRELASGNSVDGAFEAAKADLTMLKVSKVRMPHLRVRKGADTRSPFVAQTLTPSKPRRPAKSPRPQKAGSVITVERDAVKNIFIQGDHANVSHRKTRS